MSRSEWNLEDISSSSHMLGSFCMREAPSLGNVQEPHVTDLTTTTRMGAPLDKGKPEQ